MASPATLWRPGDPVVDSSSVADILTALGFGQNDIESYRDISTKLSTRGVLTVKNLKDWTLMEFVTLMRGLSLQKNARAYTASIGVAISHNFAKNAVSGSEDQDVPSAKKSNAGKDWHLSCTKIAPTAAFNPFAHSPDGRLYSHFPKRGSCDYLDEVDEHLYLDLLWLDAQAHPEPALGDYLPHGLASRLAEIHSILLPPFKPFRLGKPGQRDRPPQAVITLRFQNARHARTPYKRMVLCDKFQEFIGEKSRISITFVAEDSQHLVGNRRNDFMSTMIKVYREGTEQVCALIQSHLDPLHTALIFPLACI